MMKQPKTVHQLERVKQINEFLDVAYKDYVAARVLLLADLLPQGAVLASTAIEKYIKAILAFRGNVSHGHLKAAQFNALKNFDPQLGQQINAQFIDLLHKSYRLRYLDDLAPGFNLVIADREFLAELDWTAMTIHARFHQTVNGQTVESTLTRQMAAKDQRLLDLNHVAAGIAKQDFIAMVPQRVYAIRRFADGTHMESSFTITPRPSDGAFMRPGNVPNGDGRGVFLGFTGVEPSPVEPPAPAGAPP